MRITALLFRVLSVAERGSPQTADMADVALAAMAPDKQEPMLIPAANKMPLLSLPGAGLR